MKVKQYSMAITIVVLVTFSLLCFHFPKHQIFEYDPISGLDEFSPNVRINDVATGDRGFPSIAFEDGAIYIAWQDTRGGSPDIYFSKSLNNGTSFSPNIMVNDEPLSGAVIQKTPDIAVAGNHIYVAWEDYRNGGTDSDIYLAHSADGGGTFEPSVEVSVGETDVGKDWSPAVAADKTNGNVYVTWIHKQENNKIIAARSIDQGKTFQTVDVSDSTTNCRGAPDIGVDNNGKVYVVWKDGRNGIITVDLQTYDCENDVFIANSTDEGLSFGSNTIVNEHYSNIRQYQPSLAIDDNNDVHVAWLDERLVRKLFGVFYARSSDGCNFSPNQSVNFSAPINLATGRTNHQSPRIAVDSSGEDITVIWIDNRGGNNNIYVAKSTDGGLTFLTGNNALGGNYFFDAASTYNGVFDDGEAVIFDNGNGVLDPGILNGTDSPDKIVMSGEAKLKQTDNELLYYDADTSNTWETDEPIVFDTPVKIFPSIEVNSTTSWDNTSITNRISYLRHNDTGYYYVNHSEVMGLDGFDTYDSGRGLENDDSISSATIEIIYNTTSDYTGTASLYWSFEDGSNNTLFVPTNTNNIDINVSIDLFPLGVNTVMKIKELNISFENNDIINPNSMVKFDKLMMNIVRGNPSVYDKHDVIVYNGSVIVPEGTDIVAFSSTDNIVYMDSNLNGTYTVGEPLIKLSHAFGYIDQNDTVLQAADNGKWTTLYTPFPVNEYPYSYPESPTMTADSSGNALVVWEDSRLGQTGIYFTDLVQDIMPPNVVSVNAKSTSIMIYFSEPVNISSFNTAFSLSPQVQGIWSWDPYGHIATFTLSELLAPRTTYTITITTDLKDTSNNHMLNEFIYSFKLLSLPIIAHSPVISAEVYKPISISADIVDDDGILNASVFFKTSYENNYYHRNMTLTNGTTLAGSWMYIIAAPTNLSSIQYFIEAVDVYGNLSRVPTSGFYEINIIDVTAPVIQHTKVKSAKVGTSIRIEAVVTDDIEVQTVLVYVKPVGADDFNPPVVMVKDDNGYSAQIDVGDRTGTLEYYIRAVDSFGNDALLPLDGKWAPYKIDVYEDPYFIIIIILQIIAFILIILHKLSSRKLKHHEAR